MPSKKQKNIFFVITVLSFATEKHRKQGMNFSVFFRVFPWQNLPNFNLQTQFLIQTIKGEYLLWQKNAF